MGVQDTGCLRNTPYGYGLLRRWDGRCSYIRDSQFVSANFRMREFNPSRVHPYGVVEKLVHQVQLMRNALGVPIKITSAYRRESNTHGSGLAVDVNVPRKTFIQVTQAAYNAGFRRIEVMKRSGSSYWNNMSVGGHIHLDVYDGSGNTTRGTLYDCPSCDRLPCYPWYAWGIQGGWFATARPNTFAQLMYHLRNNSRDTGYRGC
jgi:hypothetical protein